MITGEAPDVQVSAREIPANRADTGPLRQPLSKALLLAVTVMLGLSTYIVWHHHRTWSDVQRVVQLSDFIAVTGTLVHNLQIERGLSSLYLGARQDVARMRLERQRIETNVAQTLFRNAIPSAMAMGDDTIKTTMVETLTVMKRLSVIRKGINTLTLSSQDAFDYYSTLIKRLFALRQAVSSSTENTVLHARVAALNQLNHIKELNGQIRALGSQGFASGRLPAATHQKLIQLVGIQNEHLEELPSMMTAQARTRFERIQNTPTLAVMLRLRQMLLDHGDDALPTHEAMTWFETATDYINELKAVENVLIEDLRHTSVALRRDMTVQFYGLLAVLATVLGMTVTGLLKDERKTQRIRRKLENSLQAEQVRSLQILETMSDAVCVVRQDGALEYANPAMRQAFGEDTLKGTAATILPCVGSEGCALTDQGLVYRKSLCAEAQSPISGRGYTVHCSPFYSKDNGLSRLVVMNDVTAHMMAEQRLRDAKEAAESANRTKSSLMANMSHELRTPLNAIIGFSDMMLNCVHGRLGCEQYESYARDIHHSGQHLLDLINDILDVSAIEAGKIELQRDTFNVIDTVNSALRLVMPRARKDGVELSAEHTGEASLMYADERRLKQILLNLLSNAVKFTPSGGRVTAQTTPMADGGMTITVTDTGVGMTAAEIELALEPFGQADSGLNRKHEGTGLGLPLTKGLVELHGGRLDVLSAKGAGTSVVLSFPPSPQEQGVSRARNDNEGDTTADPAVPDPSAPEPGPDPSMSASMAAFHPEDN